jgi:very-short-patch-repair endonuclease
MRPSFEPLINDLARRQHGVATRLQLLDAGVTDRILGRLLTQGRLTSMHRGIYLLGPLNPPHAPEMAAVLACGRGAVVSHRSAAALWSLLRPPAPPAPVDVTVPGRARRNRPGIHLRSVIRLDQDETTMWKAIPITTPARTVLDLAGDLVREGRRRELEQVLAAAQRNSLISRKEMLSLLARHPKRRGVSVLRELVEDRRGPALTRSEAEERLLALIRDGRLPEPQANALAAEYEVDFLWTAQRLVVEVDGYEFHSGRRRFEGDRRRDADLAALGLRVLRVTWSQLTEEPLSVLALIARLLGQGEAR